MVKKKWSLLVVVALLVGLVGFLSARTGFANSENVDTAAVDVNALEGAQAEPFGATPTSGLITAVADPMYDGCPVPSTEISIDPTVSLSVSTGENHQPNWQVVAFLTDGSSIILVNTALPSCYSNTFDTMFAPTNPPIIFMCSFLFASTPPPLFEFDCAPVP